MAKQVEHTPIYLCPAEELSLGKTFECGQCFRWTAEADGAYLGVAGGRAARVWEAEGGVFADAPEADRAFWEAYFDLDTDYETARRSMAGDAYLSACAAFGRGIRILRQDPWEALCSFIISQCNNIPRIRSIVSALCARWGAPIGYAGRTFYAFPPPEALAGLSDGDLTPLRMGYRAPYVLAAARAVTSGALALDALAAAPGDEARAALRALPGVGEKVASCAALFGLHRLDAFPVDVWVRRAMSAHLPDFDAAACGPCAGYVQQCIFYYARSGENRAAQGDCG